VKTLLIADAAVLALALFQAVGTITAFSRPLAGLVGFFFQTLFLACSAVAALSVGGEEGLIVGWCLTALAALFILTGFRSWRRRRGPADEAAS
jgi:hypothetical protein